MPAKITLNKEQLDSVIHAYTVSNESTVKIAERTGISKPTINKILRDAGVEIKKGGRYDTGFDNNIYNKEYYKKNKEKLNEYRTEWGRDNKDSVKANHKKHRENNRESIREKGRVYEKNRFDTDHMYRFKKYTRTAIWETLKTNRETQIFEKLPYTMVELQLHMEKQFTPGMTWENYGEWHVDHKTPISHFKFTCSEDVDFLICWGLDNLKPMWATTREIDGVIYEGNLNKNNRLDGVIRKNKVPKADKENIKRVVKKGFSEEEIKSITEQYENTEIGIEQLALNHHCSKLKIKKLLKENKVKIKGKGRYTGTPKKSEEAALKYKELGLLTPGDDKMFILQCKTTGKKFRDYLNKSGAITEYIKKVHNIDAPNNHFKRKFYLENDKHWFSDYFILREIDKF